MLIQKQWEEENIPAYATQVRKLGIPAFMVNYINDDCFGGATIFCADGSVLESVPLWEERILQYEI